MKTRKKNVRKTKRMKGGNKEAISIVSENGLALKTLDKFQTDPEVVFAAVSENGIALQFSKIMNKEIVLAAVANTGLSLEFAKEFQAEPEVVFVAVSNDGLALEFATEFQADKKVVLLAVASNGNALQFAKVFQADPHVVFTAIDEHGSALNYASEDLQESRDFILEAVSRNARVLMYSKFKADPGVVLAALNDESALNYASEELQANKTFILEAVSRNGLALKNAENFMDDEEVVLVAVTQNAMALNYASEELKKSREFILRAVYRNGLVLMYSEIKDKEIVLAAVAQNRLAFEYADEFKKDVESKPLRGIAAEVHGLQEVEAVRGLSSSSSVRDFLTDGHLTRGRIYSVIPFFANQGSDGTCVFVTTAKILLFNLVGLFFNITLNRDENVKLERVVKKYEIRTYVDLSDRDLVSRHITPSECSDKGFVLIILFFYFFDWLKKHDMRPLYSPNLKIDLSSRINGVIKRFESRTDFNDFLKLRTERSGGLHFSGSIWLERVIRELSSKIAECKLHFKRINLCTFNSIYSKDIPTIVSNKTLCDIIRQVTLHKLKISLTLIGDKLPNGSHLLHEVMVVGIEHNNLLISNSWGEKLDFIPIHTLPLIHLKYKKKIHKFNALNFQFLLPMTDKINTDFKFYYDTATIDELKGQIDEYIELFKVEDFPQIEIDEIIQSLQGFSSLGGK